MKGHVAGALRWRDLLAAGWHGLRHGPRSLDDFRTAFARSLGVEPDEVWLFGAGRAALHALTAALDLAPDAEVLLPGYTCVVVPNVFLHLGLPVRYVDIAPDGFNPEPQAIAAAITPRTALVVLPHNFGLCMEGVADLRARFPQVVFVEDAAHAWGSRDRQGRMAGTLGQAAFFSFEFSKPLSTGIGGALVVHDPALRARFAARAPALHAPSGRQVLRQWATLLWHRLSMSLPPAGLALLQGLLRLPARALGLVAKTPDSEVRGESQPDYHLGLHPLSAALGWAQARRHEAVWALRRQQAADYDELLARAEAWQRPARAAGVVLLRYPLRLRHPASRDQLLADLAALGIVGGTWFDDVVHPAGSLRYGYADGDCPMGEAAARSVLNLPLGQHARLSARQRAALVALAEGRRP